VIVQAASAGEAVQVTLRRGGNCAAGESESPATHGALEGIELCSAESLATREALDMILKRKESLSAVALLRHSTLLGEDSRLGSRVIVTTQGCPAN
jgi:hypothetical protein